MKRPEGVSAPLTRGAATPPPSLATSAKRRASAAPARPSAAKTTDTTSARDPLPPRTARAPRAPRPVPSRDRTAKAEFHAAERARKRYERQEVKRFTRISRRRRLTWVITLGLLVTVGVLVGVAVFSPLLALRTISVDGTSRLSTATLEKAVDSQLGTPLALLDYGAITRDLAPFTLIRSYVTEIVPPDTLVIHVIERTPVGAIQTATGFELVDPAGVVVDQSNIRPEGYPLVQLGSGTIHGAGFASMTQVLLALPSSVLSKVDTITALTHDDVTLTLAGSSQRVVWGSSSDSDAKARLLADLIALHGGSGAGEYDVSSIGTAVFHQGS